jgi:hypothetical protein
VNMRPREIAILVSLCALASSAAAQTAPTVRTGTRVRVTVTDPSVPKRVARFEAFTDSTLVVSANASSQAIPFATIQALETSRRAPGVLGGAIGLLVGSALGGVAGCAANRDSYGVFCGGQSDTKVAVGAAIGGLAGAALGAFLFRRDRWSPVLLPGRRGDVDMRARQPTSPPAWMP